MILQLHAKFSESRVVFEKSAIAISNLKDALSRRDI